MVEGKGMSMDVLKICFRPDMGLAPEFLEKAADDCERLGYRVQIQTLCNTPYLCWLEGLNTMPWNGVIDLFSPEPIDKASYMSTIRPAMVRLFLEPIASQLNIYIASQITYNHPVDGAELITSCYLWNYATRPVERNTKMLEHFQMEQHQSYYDYVAFQCVKEKIGDSTPCFNFFFESHVSNPNGINEIYEKPALEAMRDHSRAFLNTSSRLLSFGRVEVR
jgi:hypothetical protein